MVLRLAKFVLLIFLVNLVFNAFAQNDAYPAYPQPNLKNASPEMRQRIQQGEYLTKAGDCIACHSDTKHGGLPFTGRLGIKTPFGTFYSPNITPDKETGIGQWSNTQFLSAMQEGMGPDGNYFPVFPYVYFNKVNTEDTLAIKAYLDSIPPVHRVNTPHDVLPPFSWRFAQWGWKLLFFQFNHDKGVYQYNTHETAEWNRGAYLVQGLGHCAMCHSPLNFLGAVKKGQDLTGGFIDGYYAPDITSRGLNGASIDDVVNVFKKGEMLRGAGNVQGPMAEVNRDSLQYLTTPDLRAIAVYLKTVPNHLPVHASSDTITPDTGKDIYEEKCAVCHNVGAAGAPKLGDMQAWQPRIAQGMEVLVNHAINGYNSMPPKGTCMSCSDAEIKAAVQYLVDQKQGTKPKSYIPTQPPLSLAAGKDIYTASCSACHSTGGNAPRMGDKKAWQPILDQNVDVIFTQTLDTHPMVQRSDAEIIAATKYMLQQNDPTRDYSLW